MMKWRSRLKITNEERQQITAALTRQAKATHTGTETEKTDATKTLNSLTEELSLRHGMTAAFKAIADARHGRIFFES